MTKIANNFGKKHKITMSPGTENHAGSNQTERVKESTRQGVAPSENDDKLMQRCGPKRFLLFDNLIADIVDFDAEDGAPIVEFSMCPSDELESKLPVECGICPDIMHRTRLEKHIETHIKYVNGVKRFDCIYCEETFASRACAAGHLRRHEGVRPYVCELCKVYYCTKQDLKMHQRRRHWSKDHICEMCGKTFSQNSILRNHILSSHEQQRRFSCEHCGKRFLRRYAMTEHIRNVHLLKRKKLSCTFCDKVFNDTHKLAQHRKVKHLNQSSFECRVCGLEFTTIEFFDAHRRSIQCRNKYRQIEEQLEQQHNTNLAVSETEALEIFELQNGPEVMTAKRLMSLNDDDDESEVLYEIAVEELRDI